MRDATVTYYWVDSPSILRTAYALPFTGAIPILIPDDTVRRARWARVLAWYGLVEQPPAPPINPGTPAPVSKEANDRAWVLAVGPGEPPMLAAFLSHALGRPFDCIDSMDTFEGWLENQDAASILLIASPAILTAESLDRVSVAVTEKRNPTWGVLTAQDLAGLSFAAAKLIAAINPGEGSDALLDPIHRRAFGFPVEGTAKDTYTEKRIHQIIDQDWRTLMIHTHGEGAHANLESIVLCGLPGSQELDPSGATIFGCYSDSICKRVNPSFTQVCRVFDLRARIIALLSCNSFSVAGQWYPSNVSLILGAAEGYAAAVLGTTKYIGFLPHVPHLLHSMLEAGYTLGDIVRFKNEVRSHALEHHSYILYGDPEMRAVKDAPPLSDIAVSEQGTFPVPPNPLVPLHFDDRYAGHTLELTINKETADGLIVGVGRALVLNPKCVSGTGLLIDHQEELNRFKSALRELLQRLRSAATIEQTLEKIYRPHLPTDPQLQEKLTSLARLRSQTEYNVWTAWKKVKIAQKRCRWKSSIRQMKKAIAQLVALWDNAFASFIFDTLVQESLTNELSVGHALYYDQFPVEAVDHYPCYHCGTATRRVLSRSPENSFCDRVLHRCRVCGMLSEHRKGGPVLKARLNDPLIAGQAATLDITCDDAGEETIHGPGILIVVIGHVIDVNLFQLVREETFETGQTTVVFDVPTDIRYDLHKIWIAWVRGLDVSYAQGTFSVLPPNLNHMR